MTTSILVQVKGVPQVIKKTSAELVLKPLERLLFDAALIAQREAIQAAPRDTGRLGRSIHIQARPLSARVYTNLAYAETMELGRGKDLKMPPPAALEGWVRRHGFGVGVRQSIKTRKFLRSGGAQSVQSAAYVLARAIGRRGIKGRFFMAKGKAAVLAALPLLTRKMEREVEEEWRKGG